MLDDRLAFRALNFLPALLLHEPGAFLHHVPVLGDMAVTVHRLAFFFEAGSAHLFGDRFTDGLVAGMPPLLLDGVIDEFVANSILLLAGRIAILRVAAGIRTAGESEETAVRRGRSLSCSE